MNYAKADPLDFGLPVTTTVPEQPHMGPEPLPQETLIAVPTVEPDMLPEALRGYAEDCVDRGNFHFDYVASTLMVASGLSDREKVRHLPEDEG